MLNRIYYAGDTKALLFHDREKKFSICHDFTPPNKRGPMTKFELNEKRQRNCSLITGVPSGFSRLDSLTAGFQKSDLIILAARPSMGKTALALQFARNAVFENGVPVAVFSLKLASNQLSMRMLCSEARVDSTKLKNGVWGRRDWVKITGAAEILCDDRIYIDDSADISPKTIMAKVRRLKKITI